MGKENAAQLRETSNGRISPKYGYACTHTHTHGTGSTMVMNCKASLLMLMELLICIFSLILGNLTRSFVRSAEKMILKVYRDSIKFRITKH